MDVEYVLVCPIKLIYTLRVDEEHLVVIDRIEVVVVVAVKNGLKWPIDGNERNVNIQSSSFLLDLRE